MTAAVAPEPSPVLEFLLGMGHEGPAGDELLAVARARLTEWIRTSTASERALLARAEAEAAEIRRLLDRGGASDAEQQRLRRFGIATSAATAQHQADEEIDRQLGALVKMAATAGLSDEALVAAHQERAELHRHAGARWQELADLLEDVLDVLGVIDARREQGAEPARSWDEVKRDLGLG